MACSVRRVDYFTTTVRDQPGAAYRLLTTLADLGISLLAFTAVPIGPLHTQLTLFPEALSLKRVYGGPWIATIGRAVLLSLLYFVTFLIIGLLAETVVLSL